jgi:glycosyltransferase involved in cell wall biosynthesis
MPRDGAIVVATPWPRSGSANLFAAQCSFYARAGYDVCLFLGPIDRGHRAKHQSFWTKTLRLMNFPSVSLVTYGTTNRTLRPWGSTSYVHWLRNGRESMLNVMARLAAGSAHAPAFEDFVASHRIRYVHANHAFQVLLAEKLVDFIRQQQGTKPMLVIDTHDVQAQRFTTQSITNCFSRGVDTFDALLGDEVDLYDRGDVVIHICQHDLDFFTGRLCRARQGLVLPTLDPATEARIGTATARTDRCDIDFLFVGQRHMANVVGIRWFLQDVLPRIGGGYKIVIAGNIGDHFRKREPQLFGKYNDLFHFEAQDIVSLYARAAVVIVPTFGPTGSSIKLIEAMAAGKAIVATAGPLAGLPDEVRAAWPAVADGPAEFARLMVRSRAAADCEGADGARLYRTWFSNERYYAALDALVRPQ